MTMDSLIYSRLFRWLVMLFAFVFISLGLMWLIEFKLRSVPWSFHISRMHAGKVKDRMALSDAVVLYRTTGGVGIHKAKGGEPIVPDLVQRIDWEGGADGPHKAVIVAFGSPVEYRGIVTQLGQQHHYIARVDLATGAVEWTEVHDGVQLSSLKPIKAFWPLRLTSPSPASTAPAALVLAVSR